MNENSFFERRIRKRIDEVDGQIEDTRKDIMHIKVTEEALRKIEIILGRMRALAVMAADERNQANRDALDREFQQLKKNIKFVIATANYHGVNLLDGSFGDIGGIIEALNRTIH